MKIEAVEPVSRKHGVIVELVRTEDGWKIEAEGKQVPIKKCNLANLGRDNYKVRMKSETEGEVIRYAHLHCHSDNSLLDGLAKVSEIVDAIEYSGALTDHGVLCGFLEFYKGMTAKGKKPIIGFEAYVEDLDGALKKNHLILLAKNLVGYHNILKLCSEGSEHFKGKPHVTWEMLNRYHEGVIATSACLAGVIQRYLLNGQEERANEALERYISIFGDDFYIEIQRHGIPEEDRITPVLVQMAKSHGVSYIATTDSHYLNQGDSQAHEVLLCIQTQKTLEEKHMTFPGTGYHIHSSEEMEKLFFDYPEALDATLDLADKCDVSLSLGDVNIPAYPIPASFQSEDDYFNFLCREGFQERFQGTKKITNNEYNRRFEYEISVIKAMGFVPYFLMVWDYINYARKQGIYVGPGRGSAAGSLIAYCLGITDLDPIEYNLLFERFLNPERVSMPDVDIDFEHTRRNEVYQYVCQKYGEENVSHIITFGTMGARMAIKDVTRVMGYPTSVGNNLAKMIPSEPKITIDKAFEKNPELMDEYKRNEVSRCIIDVAKTIEGCKRHSSQHACFQAGTLVTTVIGAIPIEKVLVGQFVMTHRGRYQRVVRTMTSIAVKVYDILLDGNSEVTTVTGNHPLLVLQRQGAETYKVWKPTAGIKPSEEKLIVFEAGSFFERPIESITERIVPTGQVMYNLTVENDSSYLANGIVAHNCGVLIAPGVVSDWVPTSMELDELTGEKGVTAQVSMSECEDLSLLKMDFLGLRNMTVIHEVCDGVVSDYGLNAVLKEIGASGPKFRYQDIPMTDRKTYQMLGSGMTAGVFQLESPGMTRVIKDMFVDINELPDSELHQCFERLIAAVALYRPGPMDSIPDYIKGMRDQSAVHYDHESLRELLCVTYGVIVFQEQVISIVQKLAGFTGGRADEVRRAMSKKKEAVMQHEHEVFVHGNREAFEAGIDKNYAPGCIANGISEEVAEAIWGKMDAFARYAFNRSHAACYAFVAYITAYMSCHWPIHFYAAMLNAFINNPEKVKGYLAQAVRRGIKLLPPDINRSKELFSVETEKGGIRFGLLGIANVNKAAESIIKERSVHGQFKDLKDLYDRTADAGEPLSNQHLEKLIFSGALDSFGMNKRELRTLAELVVKDYKKSAVERTLGQYSLFSGAQYELIVPNMSEYAEDDLLQREYESLGVYLSGHPVNIALQAMDKSLKQKLITITDLVTEGSDISKNVFVVGQVKGLLRRYTRNNDVMYNFELQDQFQGIRCVVFPSAVETAQAHLEEKSIIGIYGRFQGDETYGKQIIVDTVIPQGKLRQLKKQMILITVTNRQSQEEVLELIELHPGTVPVYLKTPEGNKRFPLRKSIRLSAGVMDRLKAGWKIELITQ